MTNQTSNMSFDVGEYLSKLDQREIRKLEKVKEKCGDDKQINFFKLSIYKWEVNDAIKFYKNDKFCWDYCISKKCNNQQSCPYKHEDKMWLLNLIEKKNNRLSDYKYIEILCQYLLSFKKYENNSMVYRYYARLHYHMNNYDKSEKLSLKSIEIDANNCHAHNDYAILLENKRKDFKQAKIYYQKAIDLKPDYYLFYENMAQFLCFKLNKYNESLLYSSKSFSLNNNNGNATYLMGESYYHLKQWLLAHKYYQKTLQLGNVSYGWYNKQTVEKRIKEMEGMCNNKCDDLWYKTINVNILENEISRNENEQKQFYLSCLNSIVDGAAIDNVNKTTPLNLLLFAKKRFELSDTLLMKILANDYKEKNGNDTGCMFLGMKQATMSLINDSIDLLHKMDKIGEIDPRSAKTKATMINDHSSQEWKIEVLNKLVSSGDDSTEETDEEKVTIVQEKDLKEKEKHVNVLQAIDEEWKKDCQELLKLSNKEMSCLELNKFANVVKLIKKQEYRLRTQFYNKISNINKIAFSNQVYILLSLLRVFHTFI